MMAARITRRACVKAAVLSTAGAALAGPWNLGRMAHAQGSDAIKVALIGCGGRGNGALVNCLQADEAIRVIAVADAFEDKAQVTANRFRDGSALKRASAGQVDLPAERVFVGPDAYRQAIAAGPDLVLIASPSGFHPYHLHVAVQAGKHVFLEKPCCVDAPGYRLLLEANRLADQKGLKIGVGHQRRNTENYIESIRRVHDGIIGDIRSLKAHWLGSGIWRRTRANLAEGLGRTPTEMEYQVYNWINFAWLGGEQICELLTHNLDVCNWLMKAHPARAVGKCGREVAFQPEAGDICDFFEVDYTYADGTPLYAGCRWIPNRYALVGECAEGTKGQWRPGEIADANRTTVFKSRSSSSSGSMNPFEEEHRKLVSAIRKGTPYNMLTDGATTSMTAILGRMAAYEGREVTWDEAIRSNECWYPREFSFDATPPTLPDKLGSYRTPFRGRMLES